MIEGFGTLPPEAEALCPDEGADVTFVDADGLVRFFSAHRIYPRPMGCLDRDVLLCHPEASRPGIARMLSEFRDGWRDSSYFLARKSGRNVDVLYSAVHDAQGAYLGCIEIALWAGDDA